MALKLATYDRPIPTTPEEWRKETNTYGFRICTSGRTPVEFAQRYNSWQDAGGDRRLFARFIRATYSHGMPRETPPDRARENAYGNGDIARLEPALLPKGGQETGGEMVTTDYKSLWAARTSAAIRLHYSLSQPLFLDSHWFASPYNQEDPVRDDLKALCGLLKDGGCPAVYVNASTGTTEKILAFLLDPKIDGGLVQSVPIGVPDEDARWQRMATILRGVPTSKVIAVEVVMPQGWAMNALRSQIGRFLDYKNNSNQFLVVREKTTDREEADVAPLKVLDAAYGLAD